MIKKKKKRISDIFQLFQKLKTKTKIIIGILLIFMGWFWFSLPSKLFDEPTSFVIEDSKGNLLGASVSEDGQWRFPSNREVPDKFKKCIIAYEDKRFYSHIGIDPIALGRAFIQNFKNKKIVSGGSTLTMQVVRLSRKKNRNVFQKLIEGILALRLEISYSKKEILNLYASNAPFGSNVVGLEAASWRYFGRPPEELSWGEMAALSVLPNAPSLVHPGKNQSTLLRKRNEVLARLLKNKTIDSTTFKLSLAEDLPGTPKPIPQKAPHLLYRFKKEFLAGKIKGSTRIRTTINGELQNQTGILMEQHHQLLHDNGINNISAMVMEIESGNVLSYHGNIYHPENEDLESHVDMICSRRSPGSLLKPFLYALSLNDGIILPESLIPDIPTQIAGYTPENFDRNYDGAVKINHAITRSLNIPAVRLLRKYKYARFYNQLKNGGITTLNNPPDYYGLSLILGGFEITMWDVAGLYSSMARAYLHQKENNGQFLKKDIHPPFYINHEKNKYTENEEHHLSMDMTSLWYMFKSMEEVMRPGEEGLWYQFASSGRIAWKTGTSFGFRDGWAMGFNSKYLVAVWTGNADGEGKSGLIGIRTAAPLMFDIFRLLPESAWFDSPSYGYTFTDVCSKSGFKSGINCPESKPIMIPLSGLKTEVCPYHVKINLDKEGNYMVNETCYSPSEMMIKNWFVLPASMEYYYRRLHPDYQPLPSYMEGCYPDEQKEVMALYYPQQNAKIYIPVELSGIPGEVICQATHRKSFEKIYWSLDDRFIGTTQHEHQIAIRPESGKHKLTLVDQYGNRITRHFEILNKN